MRNMQPICLRKTATASRLASVSDNIFEGKKLPEIGFERAVDEVNLSACSCYGCVEPPQEVKRRQCVGHYASHVDKHVLPLSALSLVASHGIGIFDLQSVEIRVFFQCLKACALVACEFSHHAVEQQLALRHR